MNETLDYLRTFANFPFALRRFVRRGTVSLEEARRIVRERLARREETFLRLVERRVFGWPRSPYLPLLRHAGYGLSDLRALVKRERLEGALVTLRQAGVYVSFEEFKGRKPITRPGLTVPVQALDFDNPGAKHDMVRETGGSSGPAARVSADLEQIWAMTPQQTLVMAAHGMHEAPVVVWRGILPDGGLRSALTHATSGRPVRHWYSHYGWHDSRQWMKYGLATYHALAWTRVFGPRVPAPEYARIDEAYKVARGVAAVLKAEGRCVVHTGLSRAVRMCQAAEAEGLSLAGAAVRASGEPPTPAKVQWLQRMGVHFIPAYGMTEADGLAQGCANPLDESDVHLFKDSVVLITHPHRVEAFDKTVPAFNLTTLLDTAPKVLLNVQLDDYGIVEERACGCELDACGYTTHLRQIRSYSKLTGEGVTLIGDEILQILDQVLPVRFGGSPLDYQLVEQEDEQGLTRLLLVIHPAVAIPDEQAVVEVVLAGLGRSSAMADAARVIWQSAKTLQIKRAEPTWTERGKLMPLQARRAQPPE